MKDETPEAPPWTPGAQTLWNDYTALVRERLRDDDTDPAEVIEDLERHVREVAREKGLNPLTRSDMVAILNAFGLPDVGVPEAWEACPRVKTRARFAFTGMVLAWILVVLAPVAAILDELIFQDASSIYRQMFPHPLLWLAVWIVPLQKIRYVDERFSDQFPGALVRFRAGPEEVLLRRVEQPTRSLHPGEVCYRAAGYTVIPGPPSRDAEGRLWTTYTVKRDGGVTFIREQVRSLGSGQTWSEVTSWYWAALLGQDPGPWLAVTVASTSETL